MIFKIGKLDEDKHEISKIAEMNEKIKNKSRQT